MHKHVKRKEVITIKKYLVIKLLDALLMGKRNKLSRDQIQPEVRIGKVTNIYIRSPLQNQVLRKIQKVRFSV